jgi:ribulose-phosphate 3-epimerase
VQQGQANFRAAGNPFGIQLANRPKQVLLAGHATQIVRFREICKYEGRMENHAMLSASIICADLLDLQKDLQPLEVRLMVTEPERHIPAVADAGASMITFHYEAQPEAGRLAEQIRMRGLKAGVSLNPETPVTVLVPFLDVLDLVLIMAYPPGGPSREPLPATDRRISDLRSLALSQRRLDLLIALDGGLSERAIARFRAQGASFFVLGTTGLFKPTVRLEEQLKRVQAVLRR